MELDSKDSKYKLRESICKNLKENNFTISRILIKLEEINLRITKILIHRLTPQKR